MSALRVSTFLTLFLISSFKLVQANYMEDDCVKCGAEVQANLPEITNSDIIIFCKAPKIPDFEVAREHGKEVFGSLENFYQNYHRIQCPPQVPSPIYTAVSMAHFDDEIFNELEYIGELDEDKRKLILNRPDKGRRKYTVLDMADLLHRKNTKIKRDKVVKRVEKIREMLISMGAKRSKELTPSERAQYE